MLHILAARLTGYHQRPGEIRRTIVHDDAYCAQNSNQFRGVPRRQAMVFQRP
jgi:hypothetical protein